MRVSFIFSISSLVEWEYLSYAFPFVVFWKKITHFLGSQVDRWRKMFPWDGSYVTLLRYREDKSHWIGWALSLKTVVLIKRPYEDTQRTGHHVMM